MSLVQTFDDITEGNYVPEESFSRIRTALIARESAQLEAYAIANAVDEIPLRGDWATEDDLRLAKEEVTQAKASIIAAFLARAREADAKTIAELRDEIAQMKDDAKHEGWERDEGKG
jgi:hypothetical protein